MSILLSSFPRLGAVSRLCGSPTSGLMANCTPHIRFFSSWLMSGSAAKPYMCRIPGSLPLHADGYGVLQPSPWQCQQVRTRKRGTEYQPKNIKRKRTHGWIKRLSSQGGVEVILRRMFKGRKSLSH